MIDVLIVGGGPAGQSAALVLARCRREVLVIDAGQRRNRASRALHNFLTRDGIPTGRFAAIATKELQANGVKVSRDSVESARATRFGFSVRLRSGRWVHGRKLLLATGVADRLPAIPGLRPLYGVSAHHCPYCDALQWTDRALVAYGRGKNGVK